VGGLFVGSRIGPLLLADSGTAQDLRADRTYALVRQRAHGTRLREGAIRPQTTIYAVCTPTSGTSVVAGNLSPIAAGAATILSLYNPLGSGINASILRATLNVSSGAAVSFNPFAYNLAFNQTITAVQNAASLPSIPGQANGRCQGFTQTALTGSGAQFLYRPMAFSPNDTVAAGPATPMYIFDDLDGEIELPPGGLLSIAATVTGITVNASIVYAEIPSIGGR